MRLRILKNNLKFSESQKEILVGLLLGDGCLERTKNSTGARLKVSQCLRQQEFVWWLYQNFSSLVATLPKIYRNELRFNTLTHSCFKYFYDIFYPEGKKIVPDNIQDLLTPTAFTVWFMGDGSIKSRECRGRILNTQSFKRSDIERLIFVLKGKFNLISSIRKQKDGLQIYISAKSAEILNDLLKDKILPYFNYKLPFKS